uniref:CDI domain-containing protein n=1 Tax=Rhabditophanes sp. KR3021 TaxID=114890 RepID=A0AC35TM72_9BILA
MPSTPKTSTMLNYIKTSKRQSLDTPIKKQCGGVTKKFVKRNLFNSNCSSASELLLKKFVNEVLDSYSSKYNFDFTNEEPMEGSDFFEVPNSDIPSFYHESTCRSSSPAHTIENICPKSPSKIPTTEIKINSIFSVKRKNYTQSTKQTPKSFSSPFSLNSGNIAMSC